MIAPSALIIRDLNEAPSNFRSALPISQLLEEHDVPGICGVDTRKLVRHIRDHGSCRVLVTDAATSVQEGLDIIRKTPERHDAVRRRSCAKKWYARTSNPEFQVVAVDCGMKSNIVRMLNAHRCNVTIVPYDTCADEIIALSPDGVLVSNGPGDPTDVPEGYHSQPNEGFNGKSKARRVGSLFLRCFSVPSSFTFLIVSGRSSGSPECCIGSDVCSGRDPFLFHGLFRIKCSGCSFDICGHVLASGAACPGTGGTGIPSGENC